MENGIWWEQLSQYYFKKLFKTRIDERHAWQVKATALMDHVGRTGLAVAIMTAMKNVLLSDQAMKKELELLEFYKQFSDEVQHKHVFVEPPESVNIRRNKVSNPLAYPKSIHQVDRLSFISPYQTLHPELNSDYTQHKRNQRVVAQHWQHGDRPRPTLIFVHGVVLDSYQINHRLFGLRWFYKQGYDILLYTLPFHGERKEKQDLLNGLGFFSHGFAHVNEAMLQSVYDLRILMNHLQQNGVTKMGVMGFSLGAYISALIAAVDKRLSFSIPYAPVVLPIDMMMGWPPLSWLVQKTMKKFDLNIQQLRKATAIHHAINWQPAIDPSRLLIVGGVGDRFTAPIFVQALHEHWQGSEMYWYHGNHLIFLNHRKVLHKIKKFMDRCCEMPDQALMP